MSEAISDVVVTEETSELDLDALEQDALDGIDITEDVEEGHADEDQVELEESEDAEQADEEETEEPEEPVNQDTKTKLLAKLQGAEAQKLALQSELEQYKAAYEQFKDMPTPQQLKEFAEGNPKEFLGYFFGDQDAIANALLSVYQNMPYEGGDADVDEPAAQVNDPRVDEALRMAKEANDRLAAQQEAAENQYLQSQAQQAWSEIDSVITPEATPVLNGLRGRNAILPNGSVDLVFQKAASLYKQTGQVYSFGEVASAMEEILKEDLGKLTPAEAAAAQAPAPEKTQTKPAPAPKKKYASVRQTGGSTYTPPANASVEELADDVLANFDWNLDE